MKRPGRILMEGVRHLFKKVATSTYPAVPAALPPMSRGKIIFHKEKCIGCQACVRNCPAWAIIITQVGEKKHRRFECVFDLDKCIYCSQCVDSCGKNLALETTGEFELAQIDKSKFRIKFAAKDAPAPEPTAAPQSGSEPEIPSTLEVDGKVHDESKV